jgi:FHA domain-containing protein
VITLSVITFNNAPADGALSASFDELGGSIGRADTNHLVLPDPDRTVSRVAAQVVYRNGSYAIIDRGSNPITVNGQALGSGREMPLRTGDRVGIGGYELAVVESVAAKAASNPADPFADLLGPSASTPSSAGPLIDPLARAPAQGFTPAPAPSPAGGIPSDWDPFAPDPVPRTAPFGTAGRGGRGLDMGSFPSAPLDSSLRVPAAEPSSLDELFGLGPATGGNPLANSALDAPAALPNMAADPDPLRALDSAPRAAAPAMPDQSSDLSRPFIPPTTIKPPPVAPGAVMSWDNEGDISHAVIRAPNVAPVPPSPQPAPMPVPPPAVAAPMRAPSAAIPSAAGDAAELAEAFRRGLQMPQLPLQALTPELMELIGQLLREAAAGTIDLLTARAVFKRELRAQGTMIVTRNNNPLKFSPSAEVALQHLLAPPARGFMPAAQAMRDAYDDLRAHQIGFLAGMQAALEGVLSRFDPAELEKRLTERSMLHTVLPASRKARMWEVFVEHYGRIRAEAGDDFHTLFGAAFLKAYEAQIDRLHEERKE